MQGRHFPARLDEKLNEIGADKTASTREEGFLAHGDFSSRMALAIQRAGTEARPCMRPASE
jgi:hypothetical protein